MKKSTKIFNEQQSLAHYLMQALSLFIQDTDLPPSIQEEALALSYYAYLEFYTLTNSNPKFSPNKAVKATFFNLVGDKDAKRSLAHNELERAKEKLCAAYREDPEGFDCAYLLTDLEIFSKVSERLVLWMKAIGQEEAAREVATNLEGEFSILFTKNNSASALDAALSLNDGSFLEFAQSLVNLKALKINEEEVLILSRRFAALKHFSNHSAQPLALASFALDDFFIEELTLNSLFEQVKSLRNLSSTYGEDSEKREQAAIAALMLKLQEREKENALSQSASDSSTKVEEDGKATISSTMEESFEDLYINKVSGVRYNPDCLENCLRKELEAIKANYPDLTVVDAEGHKAGDQLSELFLKLKDRKRKIKLDFARLEDYPELEEFFNDYILTLNISSLALVYKEKERSLAFYKETLANIILGPLQVNGNIKEAYATKMLNQLLNFREEELIALAPKVLDSVVDAYRRAQVRARHSYLELLKQLP